MLTFSPRSLANEVTSNAISCVSPLANLSVFMGGGGGDSDTGVSISTNGDANDDVSLDNGSRNGTGRGIFTGDTSRSLKGLCFDGDSGIFDGDLFMDQKSSVKMRYDDPSATKGG